MPVGYLNLVLHAHLPFVRHPEYEDFLEEDWLYEAITETYIPLLEVFDGLERDGVDWRLTMSVTPNLAAMLSDPLLQYRYVQKIDNLIALSGKEIERTRWEPEFNHLARMYNERFIRAREVFVNQYGNNLLRGFRRFFELGKLELITCGATHGFFPLMAVSENARRAQIEVGCREFERHFGRRPRGIWLPECGYVEGVDAQLAEAMQGMWAKVNVRLEIDQMESGVFSQAIFGSPEQKAAQGIQCIFASWASNNLDPDYQLSLLYRTRAWSPAGANLGFYSNPGLDALLGKAAGELDTEKRKELYSQAQQTISDEAPGVLLYYAQDLAAQHIGSIVPAIYLLPGGRVELTDP